MSRSRNLKPGFFKNEELAELPFEYRILFQGLWCEADREGRLEDRPKRLKAAIFPYDSVDVDAGLAALQAHGFLVRYEVDGLRYVQVLNFVRHQNPHKKEAASVIPAFPGLSVDSTVQEPEVDDPAPEFPVQAPEIPERATLIPDSPLLIPDSLKQEHVQPAAAQSRFAEFWSAYPNKKGRQEAEKAWKRRKLDSRCDELIAHVRLMHSTDSGWKRGFIPMGSTYLNQGRWEDVPQREARAGPALAGANPTVQPPSKTLSAIQTLQGMKHGNRVDPQRDFGRPEPVALLESGPDPGSGHDRWDGDGLVSGGY